MLRYACACPTSVPFHRDLNTSIIKHHRCVVISSLFVVGARSASGFRLFYFLLAFASTGTYKKQESEERVGCQTIFLWSTLFPLYLFMGGG